MGYYILQSSPPPSSDVADAASAHRARLREQMESGTPPERRRALMELVAARAEPELTQCLAAIDPSVVQLAISGLWECWLGEEGPEARREMENGAEAMNDGLLDAATAIFTRLMADHPHWAEAVNKQATVFYLQGRPEDSIALCRRVVELKPDHFGAWNGMALCAIQVEDWPLALRAVRESLRLQPQSSMNRQLLRPCGIAPALGVIAGFSPMPDAPPKRLDLTGEWIGRYTGHFDEVVRIAWTGVRLEAVKITGDEHVPAGELTWWADVRTLAGEGQVAEREFRRPRFVPGRLEILGVDLIVFHWENAGSVEYRRDD